MFFRLVTFVCATLLMANQTAHAQSVTFGSGSNAFTMEFVPIGNPGNADDTTGNPNPAGSVGYTYNMGKFEVSEDMITKYNADFGTANGLAITKDARGTNKPATGVSWNEAARYVNWLNTSTGGTAAYKFSTSGVNDNIALWTSGDAGFDASNPFRNSLATYVLPSMDEWYKAAYYNPTTSQYGDYPSSDGLEPMGVASGTTDKTAVFAQLLSQGPADITQAGGLSAYGIMGMGGNVWELEETTLDLSNGSGSLRRGIQGGFWGNSNLFLRASSRENVIAANESSSVGFRVASLNSVPEPSSVALMTIATLGIGMTRRRRSKDLN